MNEYQCVNHRCRFRSDRVRFKVDEGSPLKDIEDLPVNEVRTDPSVRSDLLHYVSEHRRFNQFQFSSVTVEILYGLCRFFDQGKDDLCFLNTIFRPYEFRYIQIVFYET